MSKFAAGAAVMLISFFISGAAACGVATPLADGTPTPRPTVPIVTQAPSPAAPGQIETEFPRPTLETPPPPTQTPAPTATPFPDPQLVPTVTPIPPRLEFPTATPVPMRGTSIPAHRVPTPTLTPEPSSELSGMSWVWDGQTRIEREALYYLETIQRLHPPAFETVVEYKWLADETLTEGEKRVFCHMFEAQETSIALAIALTADPTLSPSVVDWHECPSAIKAPPFSPSPTPSGRPTATPVLDTWILIHPDRGSPEDTITISGGNSSPLTEIPSIHFGGMTVIPRTFSQTGGDGNFIATLHVPHLDPGLQSVRVTVGGRTAAVSFVVEPPQPTATPRSQVPQPEGDPVASALPHLSDNLLWVANFDPGNQRWTVYDPSGTFTPDQLMPAGGGVLPNRSSIGELTHLDPGGVYHLKVTRTANLSGQTLYAGTNLILWE